MVVQVPNVEADPRDGGEGGRKKLGWNENCTPRRDGFVRCWLRYFDVLFTRCGSVIIGDQKRAWEKGDAKLCWADLGEASMRIHTQRLLRTTESFQPSSKYSHCPYTRHSQAHVNRILIFSKQHLIRARMADKKQASSAMLLLHRRPPGNQRERSISHCLYPPKHGPKRDRICYKSIVWISMVKSS